jgi:hypothetical protein
MSLLSVMLIGICVLVLNDTARALEIIKGEK